MLSGDRWGTWHHSRDVAPINPNNPTEMKKKNDPKHGGASPIRKMAGGSIGAYTAMVAVAMGLVMTSSAQYNLVLEIDTDLDGNETTWEILDAGNSVVCSGGPYVGGTVAMYTENCNVPAGCYRLRVYDSGSNGMENFSVDCDPGTYGGYVLYLDAKNRRIIDDRGNYSDFNGGSTVVSTLSGSQGGPDSFCLPMGPAEPICSSCDKEDWRTRKYVVAKPDAAVNAQWVPNAPNSAQDPTTGYDFWFFDPNGGYSYVRSRRHNTSDGFANVGANRTAHMLINNWPAAFHLQPGVLYNYRIRSVVQGVPGDWGRACRFRIDPVVAVCPRTRLMACDSQSGGTTSNLDKVSCNSIRVNALNQYLYAQPVPGATQYQWRFRSCGDPGFIELYTTTTYFLRLGRAELNAHTSYIVDVRAFVNGAWCVDDTEEHWGPNCLPVSNCSAFCSFPLDDLCLCTVTFVPGVIGNPSDLAIAAGGEPVGRMWPNPNRGDRLWLSLEGMRVPVGGEEVDAVTLDVFDMSGRRIMARTVPLRTSDGAEDRVQLVVDLDGGLAPGMYLVNIIVGTRLLSERLVIEP